MEVINGSGGCKNYTIDGAAQCLPEFGNSKCNFLVKREIFGGTNHSFTTTVGEGEEAQTTTETPFSGGSAPDKAV
ncbi:MAG: hypothetical protein AAF745_04775, partial [Planctomycetota bacterium]